MNFDNKEIRSTISKIKIAMKQSESRMNKNYASLLAFNNPTSVEIGEILIQLDIFSYELSLTLLNFQETKPQGFAQKVFLKDIVHKLYSYEQIFDASITKRMRNLAKTHNLSFDVKLRTPEKIQWEKTKPIIQNWKSIRHAATGHYDPNISLQVAEINKISADEVMNCLVCFLAFSSDLTERFIKVVPK